MHPLCWMPLTTAVQLSTSVSASPIVPASQNVSACRASRSETKTPIYILPDWSILAAREDAEELVLGTDVEDEFQQRKAVQVPL